jgi:hypothetical protein
MSCIKWKECEALDSWASAPFGAAGTVWVTVAMMLVLHVAVWACVVLLSGGASWQAILSHWDAGWYRSIAESGYTVQSAAFYPLFPFLSAMLSWVTGLPSVFAGTLLSTVCYLIFVACVVSCLRRPGVLVGRGATLLPVTPMAWVVFVFSPASYTFHSHHTESLFLLLSFLSLWAGAEKRLLPAALLGGLAALTRNQGVLVAAAAACLVVRDDSGWRRRIGRFAACGLVSGCIYAAYPAHLWWKLGDPLAFMAAQAKWTHARSAVELFRTFLLLNPWQGLSLGNLLHHAMVIVLAGFGVMLARRSPALAVYGLGTVLLFPLQAEFASTFRFGAVLFPTLFLAGDCAARLPWWAKASLMVGIVCLNGAVTYAYAIGRWAY